MTHNYDHLSFALLKVWDLKKKTATSALCNITKIDMTPFCFILFNCHSLPTRSITSVYVIPCNANHVELICLHYIFLFFFFSHYIIRHITSNLMRLIVPSRSRSSSTRGTFNSIGNRMEITIIDLHIIEIRWRIPDNVHEGWVSFFFFSLTKIYVKINHSMNYGKLFIHYGNTAKSLIPKNSITS